MQTLSGPAKQWPVLPAIGRPVANTQVYVVDGEGREVPRGVAGEIWIAGVQLARRYLKRAGLTAQRFTAAGSAERVYRTGDVGRWSEEGTLEYLGRNDEQIKLRGYRIEPGEIEEQLRRNAAVKEAVVVAREDEPGQRRLVAYVQGREDQPLLLEELRAQVRAVLPQYMVPEAIVTVSHWPQNPEREVEPAGAAGTGAQRLRGARL